MCIKKERVERVKATKKTSENDFEKFFSSTQSCSCCLWGDHLKLKKTIENREEKQQKNDDCSWEFETQKLVKVLRFELSLENFKYHVRIDDITTFCYMDVNLFKCCPLKSPHSLHD